VKIVGPYSFKVKYGGSFEVEIEVKKKSDIGFYIDFYANDDDDGILSKGELKDLHCGRTKVSFDYTVTTDWETIEPVIPASKFVGWGDTIDWLPTGKKAECFHYALEQLNKAGYWVKSENWGSKDKLNGFIFQLYLENDVAGMKSGIQKEQFEKGVEYLKSTLRKGIPVMAGVDDGYEETNRDKTTEHFITIVGMDEDSKGKCFLFYDNAAPDKDIGTSIDNKLYCNKSQCLIEGVGDVRNNYIQGSKKKKYVITQIRETK